MSKVLGDKDVNAQIAESAPGSLFFKDKDAKEVKDKDIKSIPGFLVKDKEGKEVKSMEYHRQVFHSRMAEEKSRSYVSPSDNIMSPASAKISALRNKSALKAKPKSLFAQASVKKLGSGSPLGTAPHGTGVPRET